MPYAMSGVGFQIVLEALGEYSLAIWINNNNNDYWREEFKWGKTKIQTKKMEDGKMIVIKEF